MAPHLGFALPSPLVASSEAATSATSHAPTKSTVSNIPSSTKTTFPNFTTLLTSLEAWTTHNSELLERTVMEALVHPRLNPHNNFLLISVSPTNDSLLQVISASIISARDLHDVLTEDFVRENVFDQMTKIWNKSIKKADASLSPAFALVMMKIEGQGLKYPVCMLFNVWFCEDVEYMFAEQFGGMEWEKVLKAVTREGLKFENGVWRK